MTYQLFPGSARSFKSARVEFQKTASGIIRIGFVIPVLDTVRFVFHQRVLFEDPYRNGITLETSCLCSVALMTHQCSFR